MIYIHIVASVKPTKSFPHQERHYYKKFENDMELEDELDIITNNSKIVSFEEITVSDFWCYINVIAKSREMRELSKYTDVLKMCYERQTT